MSEGLRTIDGTAIGPFSPPEQIREALERYREQRDDLDPLDVNRRLELDHLITLGEAYIGDGGDDDGEEERLQDEEPQDPSSG